MDTIRPSAAASTYGLPKRLVPRSLLPSGSRQPRAEHGRIYFCSVLALPDPSAGCGLESAAYGVLVFRLDETRPAKWRDLIRCAALLRVAPELYVSSNAGFSLQELSGALRYTPGVSAWQNIFWDLKHPVDVGANGICLAGCGKRGSKASPVW